jgi:hypothetical protein
MAVYVDDSHIPAQVQNGSRTHDSTWCHLFADSQDELHEFAGRLGLKRSYFQPGKGNRSWTWHYDVTAGKRAESVKLGAVEVTWRDSVRIMREREARLAKPECSLGEPCHEASCGACYPEAIGRVLITGSRTWDDVAVIEDALRPHFRRGAVLVSGACPKGADAICERVWEGWGGLVERHPADWEGPCRDACKPGHRKPDRQGGTYCPAAGTYRDAEMVAEGAEVAEAFIRDGSHGATTTADLAEQAGISTSRHEASTACQPVGEPEPLAARLDYDAGVALRAGDPDTAARLIYKAREADPARGALWDSRQARIRQAMQATTERRLKDAGIRSTDPAVTAIRQYNAALTAGGDRQEPDAGRGPPEPAAAHQAEIADMEAGQ